MLRNLKYGKHFLLGLVTLLTLNLNVLATSQELDTNYIEALKDNKNVVLDALPSEVVATIETRDKGLAELHAALNEDVAGFVIDNFRKWVPGQTIRVAFLGGDTNLHRDIEEATKQITDAANIKLDFGFDSATGRYRTWSTTDTEYKAEIRVSFDQIGFFSFVGTDSISPNIGPSFGPVGGRPNQRSLNLQGFHFNRPANFKRIIRHEFMHALSVQHEHQIPSGTCFEQFRFEDDPGYDKSSKINGRFVPDSLGRRPGIFTFLSGAPNFWPAHIVKANLFPKNLAGINFQDVDRASIMLYRFERFFYKTVPNPCFPIGNGENLSEGDKEGLRLLYPFDQAAFDLRRAEFEEAFTEVEEYMGSIEGLAGAEGYRDVVQSRLDVLQEDVTSEEEESPIEN